MELAGTLTLGLNKVARSSKKYQLDSTHSYILLDPQTLGLVQALMLNLTSLSIHLFSPIKSPLKRMASGLLMIVIPVKMQDWL